MLPHVRRVLVGFDFDAISASAVRTAAIVARAFDATLSAVHAHTIEMPPYFTEGQVAALEAERAEARARVIADGRAFIGRETDIDVDVLAEEGPASDAVLRLAPKFDLLIVGTRQQRGARRWWLGSVAEAVVRHSAVPVLVVPASDRSSTTLSRGARVLSPATEGGRVEPWVNALERAFGAVAARVEAIAACDAERIAGADLIIVPIARGSQAGSDYEAIVHVLKDCPKLVLFVPISEE